MTDTPRRTTVRRKWAMLAMSAIALLYGLAGFTTTHSHRSSPHRAATNLYVQNS